MAITSKSKRLRVGGRTQRPRAYFEFLESRVLLSAFSAANMNGPWNFAGTSEVGGISFDNAGNIAGGALTNATGSPITPSGNYAINSDGTLTMNLNSTATNGAMNSTRDVIAMGDTNLNGTLSVLLSGGSASFSDNDLNGTWALAFNDNTDGKSGGGTISFDGNGSVTGGTAVAGDKSSTITGGSYNVNSDGTCQISINFANKGAQNYTGALNASKDVFVVNPTSLQNANTGSKPNLVLMTRSQGTYSNATLSGNWTLETELGHGVIAFSGGGNIDPSSFTDTSGVTSTISGSYSVSSAGKVTVNFILNRNGTVERFSLSGSVNAGRNLILADSPQDTAVGNVAVLVSGVAQPPTLTSVVPLSVATSGSPLMISYDALVAHSNAVDFDGSPIQFQITSVAAGTLKLDGSPVTVFPAIVSPGDTLAWTPPSGSNGAVTAFFIEAFDSPQTSTTPVAVAVNTIITNAISDSNLNGNWTIAGINAQGTSQFDGGGNITGGSITDSSGNTSVLSGTYELDPNGQFTLSPAGSNVLIGAINAAKDVAAVADTSHDGGSLALLVNSQNPLNGSFLPSDLNGTWEVVFDGNTPDSNGVGTIKFNGAGGITGGTVTTGNSTFGIGGSYVLNGNGTIATTLVNLKDNSTITLTGAMNNSKDIVSLSASDLQSATAQDQPLLMEFIRSGGSYSAASLKGTWSFSSDGATGAITFDGNGKVASGIINDGNNVRVISGTYSVSSSGLVSFHGTATANGISKTQIFTGALNAGQNAIVMNSPSNDTNNQDNLTVMINSADHAPTLSAMKTLTTAIGALPFTITYDQLKANATGLGDLDGDTIQFQIDTPAAGTTIQLNGVTQSSFPFDVATSGTLTIISPATSSGNVHDFSVRAFDGVLTSAMDIPVLVTTNPEPTVSISTSASTASEVNNGVKGVGTITFTRNGPTTFPLTVNYSVTDSSGSPNNSANYNTLSGTTIIPQNKSSVTVSIVPVDNLARSGNMSVTLTTSPNDPFYFRALKTNAAVTITDNNFAPLSIAGQSLNATITSGNAPYAQTGTFQIFFNASDNTFALVGGPTLPSDLGIFTYARTSATTATLELTDANGTSDGTLTFTSTTAATLSLVQHGGVGSQAAKVTLNAAPTTNFAPTNLHGHVDNHTIQSQNGIAASGTDQIIFDQSLTSSLFVVVGTAPVRSSVNNYTYRKFGPNLGIVTFTNAAGNNGFTIVLYTSATNATYVSTVNAGAESGSFQHGTSTVLPTPTTTLTPATISGYTLHNAISGGAAPFASKGTSQIVLSASTYAFTQTTPPTSSSGTYTYEALTPTIGYIAFDDSVVGPSFDVLTFTAANKANYVLANGNTTGWQRGTASLTFTPAFTFAAFTKQFTYVQNSTIAPTTPQLDLEGDSGAYHFGAKLLPTSQSSVIGATITAPNLDTATLNSGDGFSQNNFYANQAALDTAFPNGAYTVNVNTADFGPQQVSINLTGDLYPPAPFVTNYNAFQSLNATHSVTVQWAKMTGGTTSDWIDFQVVDPSNNDNQVFSSPGMPTQAGVLKGTATSITIPAGTLLPGHQYVGHLEFLKEVDLNATIPGGTITTYYSALTNFNITTS